MSLAKLDRLVDLARTLPRLGMANLARVALYRFALHAGWYRATMPVGLSYDGPFWRYSTVDTSHLPAVDEYTRDAVVARAAAIRAGRLEYFSATTHEVGFPPAWRRDPASGRDWPLEHWTRVTEFGADDIKQVWEASRFDALPVLAAAATAKADARERAAAQAAIEVWIGDWVVANPVNSGPNWRCAQETALRLTNTLVADRLLRAVGATHWPALERFVAEHCARIAPTMLYAIAQDNNHATSEAVGLYVGGLWLDRHAADRTLRAQGQRWERAGRVAFERCIRRLVMADGTFSQYSVNYHRLFLDTASLLELFRRDHGGAPLAEDVLGRLAGAARWLVLFTDPRTGDAPNLGANDGARLLQISRAVYRDFRPHAQLAAVLFCNERAWGDATADGTEAPTGGRAPTDDLLNWFGVVPPTSRLPAPVSTLFADGGYALLVRGELRAYVRLPVLRFRPGQSDLLHVDVWWRGRNVVRDGGSFSYNTEAHWLAYFSGVASHSTVQFGDRDQMPRLSRFLFGHWPTAEGLSFDAANASVACGFRDCRGAVHRRRVTLTDDSVEIEDELDALDSELQATSRLRLEPGRWRALNDGSVVDEAGSVRVTGTGGGAGPVLAQGVESRHYGERSDVPVLELTLNRLPARASWRLKFS